MTKERFDMGQAAQVRFCTPTPRAYRETASHRGSAPKKAEQNQMREKAKKNDESAYKTLTAALLN